MKFRLLALVVLYVSVMFSGPDYEKFLIDHVQKAIAMGMLEQSKLTKEILEIPGWSSAKNRHFLNNLCTLPWANYLEVGTWKGSTFVSALYGNRSTILSAVVVDDWIQYDSLKADFAEFKENCIHIKDIDFQIHELDCFTMNKTRSFRSPINIYFYDGNHSAEAQEKAFTYFNDVFAPVFIAVIDDWNWPSVQTGTRSAIAKLGYKVLFEQILPARFNCDEDLWWNGVYVAVLKKP